ncbi:hypothetical protein ACROYT_G002489 [Oculina patagonica]
MMFAYLISALLGLFLFSVTVDATAKESMEVRVFNPNFQVSDEKMIERLKEANLEGNGYKKEVTTKLVSDSVSDKPVYQKSYRYYKEVPCSQLREIDQELQTLLPKDIFGRELVEKINKEIESKDLTNMKQCQVGLQVHFKESEGCYDKTKNVRRRKRGCSWCLACWNAKLAN